MLRASVRGTVLAALLGAAVMAPATAGAAVDPLTLVSGPSPFAAGCEGAPQTGTVFRNAEVEPWVDVNLADANNLVGDWQQDRWSNGGASGNLSAFSLDGGMSWTIPPISPAPDTGQAKFSRCTGGNAANGGDFERATDPWVSFSPNGVAHQVALGINDSNVANAVLTSRSSDKGANWEDPVVVKFDDQANFFNDKETLTADPTDSRFVYVTWQRIVAPSLNASARAGERAAAFRSFAWFARSDDNGVSYDVVKPVFNPGNKAQTIGNQIVVLPNGDLVMLFNLIRNVGAPANRGFTAAVMRSTDRGDTWSAPIRIDRMITNGVTDPADGHDVRTGDLIPQIAVDDDSGDLYVVWQDDRFTGQEQIAFSSSTDGGRTWSDTQRISTTGGVNQAFTPTVRVADDGTVAVQHYDFRSDNPNTTPPLTTDVWLLRSADGGANWTEERVGSDSFDMTTAPDALGYFVGDYAGLDFAGAGLKPGFKPFHVRANSGNLTNRTDVFATTASTSGP
jgi:BNR repeat-like domain